MEGPGRRRHGPGFHSSMNHTIRPRCPPRYPQQCAISSTSPSPQPDSSARPYATHDRNLIGPVVPDLDPDPRIGPVYGHDDLPASAGCRVRDGVGDQLAGQQDRIIGRGAPAEDLADELAAPAHLVTGAGEDPPPGPDDCRGGHDARPVPAHARHSVRARRSSAHSPASLRGFLRAPQRQELPAPAAAVTARAVLAGHRGSSAVAPGRDHVLLVESLVPPCFDAGQETRRVARRISDLTYRHVSSCLVIFCFSLP